MNRKMNLNFESSLGDARDFRERRTKQAAGSDRFRFVK